MTARHKIPLRSIKHGPRYFLLRLKALLSHPLFLFLTLLGNGFMLIGAALFYLIEHGTNPKLGDFLDALWWSVATVTTVGYGDIGPVTTLGKWIGILMMIFGTALFSSFTALFASILMQPELTVIEEEVRELEREMQKESH